MKQRSIETRVINPQEIIRVPTLNCRRVSPALSCVAPAESNLQHLPSFPPRARFRLLHHNSRSHPETLAVSSEHLAPAKYHPLHAIHVSRYSFAQTPTAAGQRPRLTQAIVNPPRRRCKQHLTSWLPTWTLCEEASDLSLGLGSATYAAFICLLGAPREDEPSWLWCGRQWPTFFRAEQF